MSEAKSAPETARPTEEDRDYFGILKALSGKKVTVINPESYEATPMKGFQLTQGFYPGKVTGWGRDYLVFQTVLALSKKEGGQQPVQQYIPVARIKRVSVLKTGVFLHL